MRFLSEMGQLALGSRFKALSERMYGLADRIYAARGSDLKGRWFPVVRLLHDRGPLSVSEIAEEIAQTHSAVSQLADKLVRDGWLRVLNDARDERRRLLTLTDKTKASIRDVKPVWKAIKEVLAERCAALDCDVLATLDKFEQLIEEPTLAAAILLRANNNDRAGVRIVPFAPELSPHFYRLNEQWLRKYFYVEEIDHRVLSNPEAEILRPGGAILFALLGDSVVGTCALKLEEPGHYELTKMAVDDRYQGLGIGRRLLEAAIAEFIRRKGRLLFLETNSRLAPALQLYESFGFERQPTNKPDSNYQRADVYMIWRPPIRSKGQGNSGSRSSAARKRKKQSSNALRGHNK